MTAAAAAAATAVALSLAGCVPKTAPPRLAETSAWLEVEVLGLASSEGQAALALFASAEAFTSGGEPVRRDFLPIEEESCVWRLEDLPPGDYAVKVFHDLDGSGELEKSFVGVPTEPYGFSNEARGQLGPPGWRQARFRLAAGGARIAITVR